MDTNLQDNLLKNDSLKILDFINNAKNITLLTHLRPDGDGISAATVVEDILIKLNKNVETIYPSYPEFNIKRQPKKILINKHNNKPDLIISLDTANYSRLYYPDNFRNVPLINIDHHISNSISGIINIISPNSSSTCELLYEIIKIWDKIKISKYIAESLLFGILYDTNIFQTQSTSEKTLNIASELIKKGANLFQLKTELLSNKNPNIVKLWGQLLSDAEIDREKSVVWSKITQSILKEYKLTLSALIGFNNFLSQLSNIEYSLLFYELDEHQVKVSLRSKHKDVNKIASKLGGGGHKNAAGILVEGNIDTIIKKVLSYI